MSFRHFLSAALLLLPALAPGAETKPNILLIIAENLGIHDLGCYGRRDQPTPALDQLAAQGARFTSAYCAQPVGTASRAALLTGKAPARLHLTGCQVARPDKPSQKLLQPESSPQLALDEVTLAEALQPAGYVSGYFGPWDLGGEGFSPEQQGFAAYFGGKEAVTLGSNAEAVQYDTEVVAKALEFVQANREQPFFAAVSLHLPSVPLEASPTQANKPQAAFNPPYALAVGGLDSLVGRVLAKLDELKLAQNTIVLFTSSNGGVHVPQGPATPRTENGEFRAGRGYLYEGGLRVPLLVRWPGQVPARVEQAPISLGDLLPTLAEVTGAAAPAGLDFASMAGLLRGKGERPAEFYWHFPHYTDEGSRPAGAMRLGEWKLVEDYESGHAELYNLSRDPGEKTDLTAQEPDRVAELRGKLAAWRQSMGAEENAANAEFNLSWYNEIYGAIDASNLPRQTTAEAMRTPLLKWRQALDRAPAPRPATPPPVTAPGFLILPAREAIVHGTALRYEPQPQKNTLGFWKYAADTAAWRLQLLATGRYAIDALIGCGKGSGGASVSISAGGPAITFEVAETGHFQNFAPQRVGTLRLLEGVSTITVEPKSKPGVAVMDLRQLTLTKISD